MIRKLLVLSIITGVIILYSCTKDKGALAGTVLDDEALFNMAKDTNARFPYVGTSGTTFTSVVAEHGNLPYSLLMNKKAKDACTDNGKLPTGSVFPDSSLLVKQLRNGAIPVRYAVMYKQNGSWKWGEYNADGTVRHGVNDDASVCTGCHISNRDNAMTFDIH